ncbi:hypothetical protein [Streptomyces sp. 8N706]|uniref:hypothetical protein n=1 Tax=Streptomyces sp. 8N706 TaxID=3457416 RepID=UPI003FD20D29
MNARYGAPHHSSYRGPGPGQEAYDPVSGRAGVVQAVLSPDELLFEHHMTGKHIAFLRPAAGGVEWTADAEALRFPAEREGDPPHRHPPPLLP